MTTPKKSGKGSKRHINHPPSVMGMITLLAKYSFFGVCLLCFLIIFHGRSPRDVFFHSSSVVSPATNEKFGSDVPLESNGDLELDLDTTADYPISSQYDSAKNVQDNSDESSDLNDEILASPEEAAIERKERQQQELSLSQSDFKDISASSKTLQSEGDAKFGSFGLMKGELLVEELGNLKFSDGADFLKAPVIHVGELLPQTTYDQLWSLQKLHDEFFIRMQHRKFIPHLSSDPRQKITRLQFHQIFRQTSTPVVIPFDAMRHLGFLTKAYTIEELRQRFPYTPPADGKVPLAYNTKSGRKEGLDLGPALYALEQDMELAKGKGFKRNFPRNLMLKSKYLSMLEISYPPFVPKKRFQPPTLWFGTSTADTKLHSDCCDNFVQMLSGTKRWFIAPPSDSRHIQPIKCDGVHQSLCWAGVQYPNAKPLPKEDAEKLGRTHAIVLDLKAGDMLYLPAGWWHHIENLGPTIMVNFWTLGCENVAVALDLDPTRMDRNDFKKCPAVARADAQFVYS